MAVRKQTNREQDLQQRVEELEARLWESEEALRAIQGGEVDAVIVSGSKGEHIFSLSGTESIYRLIVETMNEAAFTITFDGMILFCNAQFGHLLKRPMEQIVGHQIAEFVAPDNLPAAESLLTVQKQPVNQRLVFHSSDDTYVPVYISTNLLDQPDGPSICVVGTNLTDLENSNQLIQQLRRQEEALRQAKDELARSNKDLEAFAYVASHDLQEPLRMVTSFMDLLRDQYRDKLDARAEEYIAFAVDGASRMATMVTDLLAYSRAGSKGFNPTHMETTKILHQAMANLRAAIDESQALITYDPLPTVVADAAQMTKVFQNLLSNAIKFRQPDRRPEIHISANQEQDYWLFKVSDNGIGIDQNQAERVFQVFQRLHSHKAYSGSGIGLSICKRIIVRHGGSIFLKSQPGQGSTFFFTLPVRQNAADKTQQMSDSFLLEDREE